MSNKNQDGQPSEYSKLLAGRLYTTIKLIEPHYQHKEAFLIEIKEDKALVEFRHTGPWHDYKRWINISNINLSS